ncbi:hypothetical protein V2A60_003289 [Cordyceps javanica]|uniref:Uncharacterized protein n=1 Tax=Cordyceps javanica TaxID=43265 RepID=A0A545V3K6_9HYPO|nr:hypothetical protein IF1G_04873 [Cordyceps javanica]TQW07590.1 hypothetical protein IF2G_04751 [Cordyceps javanica]
MAMRRLAPAARLASFNAPRLRPLPNQRILLKPRQISLLPWRKSDFAAQPLPVYFPKPVVRSRLRPVRRFVGRVLFTTAAVFACWTVFYVIVLEPLFDWAEDEWDALSEKEKQEIAEEAEDGPDSILFLPMPFGTIEVKQPPYRSSDPEWQEFVVFSRNKQAREDIKHKLADLICKAIQKSDQYVRILGGKDIRVSQFWLDTIFPARPPPKHYVAGISIEDDGIYWAHRPIDSLAAKHLSLAIYPAAVAKAAWSFLSVLGKGLASDTAVFLGIAEPTKRPPTWESVVLNRMQQQETVGPGANRELQDLKKTLQSAVSVGNVMPSNLEHASSAAMVTLAKTWKPARQGPGPGCIKVDGLIQVSGKKAYMAVYVVAWFDPKQKKFVDIQTQLKHLLPFQQYPAK